VGHSAFCTLDEFPTGSCCQWRHAGFLGRISSLGPFWKSGIGGGGLDSSAPEHEGEVREIGGGS
jgi:hypothetical protein